MKKVFSNSSEVIHLWAQQSQEQGRCSNVFFEGTTRLYSYGYHYPLGLFVTNKRGEKAVIINNAGYSSTTSSHISGARYATNQYKQFMLPSTEAMKGIEQISRYKIEGGKAAQKQIITALSEAIINRIESYNSRLRNDTTKCKATTLQAWKDITLSECNGYLELLDWYGFKMSPAAKKAVTKLSGTPANEAREVAQKAAQADKRKRDKAEKARQVAIAKMLEVCIPAWIAGSDSFIYNGETKYTRGIENAESVYLRITGDNIETSKGASFPVEHGLKALPLIKQAIGKGWKRNGHTIHLGHYQLDEILPNGDVKAGCHYVPYIEIERIAVQLAA